MCFHIFFSIIRIEQNAKKRGKNRDGDAMRYEKLIENIVDQIKEAQMKLGYAKESLRLYYPVATLNAMLGISAKNAEEMLQMLKIDALQKTVLGELKFSSHKQRIEIGVSSEGAEYVHTQMEDPAFLRALIELFRNNHHCHMDDVKKLFAEFSETFVCQKMPEGSDFDYVFYFEDTKIDRYFYCVKEEMGHTIYHRFTREDMVELLKDE